MTVREKEPGTENNIEFNVEKGDVISRIKTAAAQIATQVQKSSTSFKLNAIEHAEKSTRKALMLK